MGALSPSLNTAGRKHLERAAKARHDFLPAGDPAEPSKIVAFSFGIDRDAFVDQTVPIFNRPVH